MNKKLIFFLIILFDVLCFIELIITYPERIDLILFCIIFNVLVFGTILLYKKGKQLDLENKSR